MMPNPTKEILIRLLPLDGRRRFAGDIEHDAIDPLHLVTDTIGNSGEDLLWWQHPVGGHSICRFDDPDGGRAVVGSLIPLDADRTDREEHRETLPDIAETTPLLQFFPDDAIGGSKDGEPVPRDLSDDPDSESRSGEWLSLDDLIG